MRGNFLFLIQMIPHAKYGIWKEVIIIKRFLLEDIATEFDIQGLEIDYVCLAWDINFYHDESCWQFQNFKGTKWQKINQETAKSFLLNSYRVLMTRARQGMVIIVPEPDETDITRPQKLYNLTYEYLLKCGIKELI